MWWKRRHHSKSLAAIVARLEIPRPFQLHAFLEVVAVERGRPLIIAELQEINPDIPCGMWMSTSEADHIFYKPAASPILRTQIVLHELAHMLLEHKGPQFELQAQPSDEDVQLTAQAMSSLLHEGQAFGAPEPVLPAAAIMRAEAARIRAAASAATELDEDMGISPGAMFALLGRTKYSGPEESDAENLATLIHEKASRTEARSRTRHGSDVLERLSDAFGHPTQ
ncbi:hypothetical protein ABTX82_06350 [Streptomyces lavendulae]|uniref:hypothetical protein n=1 Tax=Streptomyces lavendulae TaxID=1914 RepID=UPI003328054A